MTSSTSIGSISEIGRSPKLTDVLAGGGLLVIVSAMPLYVEWVQWAQIEALRAEWTVAGPACPVVEKPAPWATRRKRAPMSFSYGGIKWTRQFAAVSCAAVPKPGFFDEGSYHVCSFNNPGAVTVEIAGRSTTFQPPPGGRATVTVRDGVVSCVVGGRFNY